MREIQRLEKLLEDSGIKLSSVASDITGGSGRAMLEALIAGGRDPVELAELAKRRMRVKIPALTEALTGRFGPHHAFLARLHLDLIDQRSHAVEVLTARIEVVMTPILPVRDLLVTIPGVSTIVADVIIAETEADMTRFPAPPIWLPGRGPVRAATSPRDASNPLTPDPATPNSRARWVPPRCPALAARTPTSRPSTGATPPGAGQSKRS